LSETLIRREEEVFLLVEEEGRRGVIREEVTRLGERG
jgi:hypothetical protein